MYLKADLGPAENGTYAKLSIFSMFSGRNRSGLNVYNIIIHATEIKAIQTLNLVTNNIIKSDTVG